MKKTIALVVAIILFSINSIAQNKVIFNDFPKKGQKTELISQNIELTFNKKTSPNSRNLAPKYYILIERNIDEKTAQNYKTSKSGKFIPSATVILKNKNKQLHINMNMVSISEYKILSKSGKVTESFKLTFKDFSLK